MTSQHTSSFSIARFLGTFVGLFLLAFAFQGCLNDDNLIGENCYDGILNNGEELVDCGGPICDDCDLCENGEWDQFVDCLLYTSPSPRDRTRSRMPSSA